MKTISLCLLTLLVWQTSVAQRTIPMRNLWAVPEVHVLFQGYTVSYTIKDINKALLLLVGTGDSTYGTTSRLDTNKTYTVELYAGVHMEYRNTLQPLLQNGVGAYLLSAGHALIKTHKRKTVREVVMDIQPMIEGTNDVQVNFYDPRSNKLLFAGKMPVDMYRKDLGID
jgi:hypothetical protein